MPSEIQQNVIFGQIFGLMNQISLQKMAKNFIRKFHKRPVKSVRKNNIV